MKQLQVSVPKKFKEKAEEILEDYSSDISSSEAERNDEKVVEFTVTAESDQIDELTEELKDIEDLESGDLSIRVLEQESLIEKGQPTRGGASMLSQEEVYSKAQEASTFNKAQWGLIGLSSAIAAYGLALNNLIVVIGAMMLAPMLSPFVSGAISLSVGDRNLMVESLKSGVASVLIAVAVSFVAVLALPVSMNPTLQLVASSSTVNIFLSLLVGAAAALTFATGLRDQIAGVAVAIALVPPLASVGIGLKMQNMFFVAQTASIASINILSVIIAGYLTFQLLGIRPGTYYKKKEAEKLRYLVPAALVFLALLSVPIFYSSYQSYQGYVTEQRVDDIASDYFGEDLLEVRESGSHVTVIAMGNHSRQEFMSQLPEKADVELVMLRKVG
ncbi:MAG: TIGR00341 family protein [Candidatus Nanohaloarchaea archaeon]